MTENIPKCGNSHFPATLIFHEINFGWFQRVKHCHFNNFEFSEHWILEKCQNLQKFKIQSYSNGQNGRLWVSKWLKLISRNMYLSDRNILKFLHYVFPIRLPKSVIHEHTTFFPKEYLLYLVNQEPSPYRSWGRKINSPKEKFLIASPDLKVPAAIMF